MNPSIALFGASCALVAWVMSWLVTYLIMSRSRRLAEDRWSERCKTKYQEGYDAHRRGLLRQMTNAARTHVPWDEGAPRPMQVHRRQIRPARPR